MIQRCTRDKKILQYQLFLCIFESEQEAHNSSKMQFCFTYFIFLLRFCNNPCDWTTFKGPAHVKPFSTCKHTYSKLVMWTLSTHTQYQGMQDLAFPPFPNSPPPPPPNVHENDTHGIKLTAMWQKTSPFKSKST